MSPHGELYVALLRNLARNRDGTTRLYPWEEESIRAEMDRCWGNMDATERAEAKSKSDELDREFKEREHRREAAREAAHDAPHRSDQIGIMRRLAAWWSFKEG